jgi:hypothetical protein
MGGQILHRQGQSPLGLRHAMSRTARTTATRRRPRTPRPAGRPAGRPTPTCSSSGTRRRVAAPDRRADVRPARGATLTTTGAALRSLWCRRRQPAPCH